MKFTVNGKNLKTELECVRRVIEVKPSIPVLENVLLRSIHGRLTLTGTNLDQYIETPLEAAIDTEGSICVSAKQLSEMTKTLKTDITFELVDNFLMLTCGKIAVKMPTCPAEQYPEIPNVPGPIQLTMSGDDLRTMVQDTSMAVTTEQSRFTLMGGKFESSKTGTRLIATDGHRLAYTAVKTKGKAVEAILPIKALTEAARMANCTVDIASHNDHVRFSTGGRTLITRVLKGQFPNYEMVMPKDNDKLVAFDIAEMKDAMKRALATANPRNQSVRMTFRNNEVVLETENDECTRTEIVPIEYQSDEMALSFNIKYISEFLTSVGSGKGLLSFKNKDVQAEFTIEGYDYDYHYILMPLRI